jgi:hypothetical protein
VTVRTQPGSSSITSIGRGLLFAAKSANFWTQGHFVYTPEQIVVVSKYSDTGDADVGFEVTQDIVTVDDTDALYDNQGAVPNISSPGADRFRIRLTITTRSEATDKNNFIFFASIRDGKVTQVSGGSTSYNEVERRMAQRTFDTNGDFEAVPFEIRFKPGDSSDHLNLFVPATTKSGANPLAFVDGFRLQHYNDSSYSVLKPVSVTTEDGQTTSADYRNYVNVHYDSASAYLGGWTSEYNLNEQTKMALVNTGGDVIGNGRIKHVVNTLDDSEGYRIHWYDVKMKAGQNARDVRSFRPYDVAGNGVGVTLVSGQMYAVEPEINKSLFEVPGGRVKSVANLNFTVQRQFSATSNGASQLQITTNASESFDDVSRWVFINTTTGAEETVPPGNIVLNSASPQTATVAVSSASNDYIIYAYVEKNSPSPKTKTYARHGATGHISAARVTDSGGERFQFGIYDGISLLEARADSAAGRLITDEVTFDGGQRDNFYGPVVLNPEGLSSSVSNIFARFEYFDWGTTGDYFSVNSYVLNDSFSYADIPNHRSLVTDEVLSLRQHIDFRPKLDPYADTMTTTDRFETIRDGDNISYDVEWYNRRIDNVSLGYNPNDFSTEIRINKGQEDLNPSAPPEKVGEMILFTVSYGGNTLDVTDLSVKKHRHKRFRMEDIAQLEQRVDTLEETVSLSFLEQEAANLVELNSSGEVRSKTGFFVDDFKKGLKFTGGMFEPYWSEDDALTTEQLQYINRREKTLAVAPKNSTQTVQILFDSDNRYTGRTSSTLSDVVRKGDILYLDHVEVLDSSLNNEVISWYSDGKSAEEQGWYNVNPYNVFTGEGFLKLSPATDTWTDTYHLPDQEVIDEEIEYTSGSSTPVSPPLADLVEGTQTIVTVKLEVTGITEDVVAYAVPFARQREVFGKVQGLRPNTRYWPFFDNVNVEQWTISETETEHDNHLKRNHHLRAYPEVDVTIRQHPRRSAEADSVLISDYKGELHFSFWLPNNAPVPTPNGNELNSMEEWEQWIDEQNRLSSEYNGAEDPRVYDDIGWKFRSGSLPFLLNDVSVSDVKQGLSNAKTIFTSNGSIALTQKTIHMTRTTTTETVVKWVDPLAQSIMIDGREGVPGAFVTKVDVFMRRAPHTAANGGTDLSIPLQLQVREMSSGVPVAYPAGEQYRIYKTAEDVYSVVNNISNLEDLDDVLSNPVTFEFPEPIYLEANQEYAIVLMSECDNYEAFVSTTYGLILGKTEERVNKQPATGSLFLSQNGSTWTPKQDQNLAYRIYTAKFKSSGAFNLFNSKFDRFRHNTKRMVVADSDLSRFRVLHMGHGLGVGDTVALTGLDSSASYLGLPGSTLMDSSLVVEEADVAGYFVQLNDSFVEAGQFGADSASTNQGFNFDHAWYFGQTKEFPGTSVNMEGSFVSGVSHSRISETATADPRFDFSARNTKLSAGAEILFPSPRYLGNPSQELNEIATQGDSSPSIVIGTQFLSNNRSTFGGPLAANAASSGYVSDVSPIMDLQRSMMLLANNLIDNQPLDSASASSLNNTPFGYLPETHPTSGTGPSKHITKPVVLGQAANGIRIFIDAFKPIASDFDVYFRTTADADADIYEVPFTLVTPENDVPSDAFSPETLVRSQLKFSEYRYLAGGEDGDLDDFTKFQVKIVMRSTNTCEIPLIKSIRTIALV